MSEAIKVALIVACAPLLAVGLSWWQQHIKIKEIHVLVNSRLSEALAEIVALRAEVSKLRDREDKQHG